MALQRRDCTWDTGDLGPDKYQVVNFSRGDASRDLLRDISGFPDKYIFFATRKEAVQILDLISYFRGKGGGCCVATFSEGEGETNNDAREFAKTVGNLGYSVETTGGPRRGHISPTNYWMC